MDTAESNADQEVVSALQPQPQDYSAYESYGLTYHHFDQSDDVNRNFDLHVFSHAG